MKNLYSLLIVLIIVNGAMAQWVQQNSGTTQDLNSVYFINSNTGYAVGAGGIILKTTDGGDNWEIQSSGTVSYLNTVQFPVADTGYIGCADGNVLKTIDGGSTWTSIPSGISGGLGSVYFVNPDLGYALNSTYIFKTTNGGDQWSIIYTESEWRHFLTSLFFPEANIGYAVGWMLPHADVYQSYILKTNNGGMSWTNVYESIPEFEDLVSLYFINADTGYVVGGTWYEGVVFLKTTNGGTDWTTTNLVRDWSYLYSVYFTDANTGYVVGKGSSGGIIYKTINGGNDWISQTSGTGRPLYSVHFPSMDTGYIVGGNGTILKTSNGGYVAINDDKTIANTLIVYPNPSSEKISIATFAKGFLSILNLNGQELLKEEITATKTQIDISNLSNGVYFLKITGERTVRVGKFIKN